MSKNSPSQRGFTLIELLVVIALCAMLISMMLPAFAVARQRAVAVSCQSQLRQLGAVLAMYANENQGWLYPVGAGGEPLGFNMPRSRRWPVYVFSPSLWNPRLLLCPGDPQAAEEHTYVLNFLIARQKLRRAVRREGLREAEIPLAAEKFSINEDYFVQGPDLNAVVDPHHHGIRLGSNYLYLDLHVSTILGNALRPADWQEFKTP